jgi:hypothetical protein
MAVGNLNTGAGIPPTIIDAKGDLLVGTADNVVNRLGVTGTTGAVLTADAGETTGLKWAAAGSVGGLVHIKTEIYSATTAVNFNNVFTSDYTNYLVTVVSNGDSADAALTLRLRSGGTDESSAVYDRQELNATSTTVNATSSLAQTSLATGAGTRRNLTSNITFYRPQKNTRTDFLLHNSNYDASFANSLITPIIGLHRNNYQADGFTAIFSAASSGQINVYGYKD